MTDWLIGLHSNHKYKGTSFLASLEGSQAITVFRFVWLLIASLFTRISHNILKKHMKKKEKGQWLPKALQTNVVKAGKPFLHYIPVSYTMDFWEEYKMWIKVSCVNCNSLASPTYDKAFVASIQNKQRKLLDFMLDLLC